MDLGRTADHAGVRFDPAHRGVRAAHPGEAEQVHDGGTIAAVADRVDDEQRLVRAALIGSHLVGLTMMRWVWKIEPIASWRMSAWSH
jgi:Tetracyclin repressor-like, C-terminal domain